MHGADGAGLLGHSGSPAAAADALRKALHAPMSQAMYYLDPDSFEGEGPGPSEEEVQQLGHAFIPCLLNRRAPTLHAPDSSWLPVSLTAAVPCHCEPSALN